MKKVLIVDDSSFSRSILSDILSENGFEVVGEVDSPEDLIDTYVKLKPDIVTMDIAMPQKDGFECTEMIMRQDPNAKVIMVSSMKDDEVVKQAKRIKVAGFVQKPVDAEELVQAIQLILSREEIYTELDRIYLECFSEALENCIVKMSKTSADIVDAIFQNESRGISVISAIIGKHSGRMILDMDSKTAESLARLLYKREIDSQILQIVAEFANVVCGNAISILNRKNKNFGLRVAPPTIFYGENLSISTPEIVSKTVIAEMSFGKITLNVGFTRGDEEWM